VSPPDADHVVQAVRHQFLKYPERPASSGGIKICVSKPAVASISWTWAATASTCRASAEEVVWLITNTEGAGEGEPIAVYEGNGPCRPTDPK